MQEIIRILVRRIEIDGDAIEVVFRVPPPNGPGQPPPTDKTEVGNIVQAFGERTFAWLGRCRRLAKDWECLNRKALAFLSLASIRLMLRKLCNPT